jgi:hypothetical protein
MVSQILAEVAVFGEFDQGFERRRPTSEGEDGAALLFTQFVQQHQFSKIAVEYGFEIDIQLHSVVFQTLTDAFVPVSNFNTDLQISVLLLPNFDWLRQ